MLKLIPQENPSGKNKKNRAHGAKATWQHQAGGPGATPKARQEAKQSRGFATDGAYKKNTHFMHLQMKIRQFEKNDQHLFANAGKQLMNYLKKAENITLKELSELIHSLQRTVIGLQKKRIRMVQKEQRKKKRKSHGP